MEQRANKLHQDSQGKLIQGARKPRVGRGRQSLEGGRVEGRAKRCEKAMGERGEAGKDHGKGKKGRKALPKLINRQQQNLKIAPSGNNRSSTSQIHKKPGLG